MENNSLKHLAIIMDGNGRYAKNMGKPRFVGHQLGMENVENITLACDELGIKVLTLYAFSTENWARPKEEVAFLMNLPVKFFNKFMPTLMKNNVRVKIMGFLDQLPEKTYQVVQDAMEQTRNNTGLVLNFAFNYGSRKEIVAATQAIAQKVADHELQVSDIDEELLSRNMLTGDLGDLSDPDLLIRTSGEERLSNFLLWQLAYTEFAFTDKLWPEFTKEDLTKIVQDFQKRHRRFGGLDK
ncbi:MAG: isoprenyl transferase [Lactobacillus sp.]|nr:isoprenyl transferase [Lactobacillus sp.]